MQHYIYMLYKKFPTVKSALLLLFYIFIYCWLDPLLGSGSSFLLAGPCFKNWIQKCCTLLHAFYKRRKVTLKELQSLLGLLNFACSVVVPGLAFLRRMIDLTKGAKRPHQHIRLTREVKHDIAVWLTEYGQSLFVWLSRDWPSVRVYRF